MESSNLINPLHSLHKCFGTKDKNLILKKIQLLKSI